MLPTLPFEAIRAFRENVPTPSILTLHNTLEEMMLALLPSASRETTQIVFSNLDLSSAYSHCSYEQNDPVPDGAEKPYFQDDQTLLADQSENCVMAQIYLPQTKVPTLNMSEKTVMFPRSRSISHHLCHLISPDADQCDLM